MAVFINNRQLLQPIALRTHQHLTAHVNDAKGAFNTVTKELLPGISFAKELLCVTV